MDSNAPITGYHTRAEAVDKAQEVSANGRVRELEDGTWVAIGDLTESGSSIWHQGGVSYVLELDEAYCHQIGLIR